jgi:hypothetical protein
VGSSRRHLVAPLALALPLAVTRLLGDGPFHAVVTEDGPYEWAQVLGYGAAAVGFAAVARRRRLWPAAVLALGFVAVAGEEVAWGQRLLDLDVAAVQDANVQGELTLHNLPGGLGASWAAFAALALAGAVTHRLTLPGAWRVLAPPAALRWWFLPGVAYAAFRLAVPSPTYGWAKASEWVELCAAIGWALTARPASARDQERPEPDRQRAERAQADKMRPSDIVVRASRAGGRSWSRNLTPSTRWPPMALTSPSRSSATGPETSS